jgi:acetyl esterase/lipase
MNFTSLTGLLAATVCLVAIDAFGGEFDAVYGQTYVQRDSGHLKADIYTPKGNGPFPGVLVVHGGAWRMGTRGQLTGIAQRLAQHGMTAVAISYRLAPDYKFPAQIEDCKEAVRWMRTNASKLKIDADRIGGFGYSAGAHLVTLLGTSDATDGLEGVPNPEKTVSTRLQAVAAGGAPCDFRPIPKDIDGLAFWLGGSPRQVPEQYRLASPASFITPDDPPMFFFHGESDRLVPLMSPERMTSALAAAGIESELYVVPMLGHTAACWDRTAIDRSIAFLAKHLQPKEGS